MVDAGANAPTTPLQRFNLQKVRDFWNGLSRQMQIALVVFVAVFIIAMVLLIGYTTRTRYAVLFSGLDPSEASDIIATLEEQAVPYLLEENGTAIWVPEDNRDRLRLQLSTALYEQDIGFTIFDREGLGLTDFDRRMRLQRALQEELRRTIVSIEGVEQARVHLVMPEPSVFVRETPEPTASITLQLKPLVKLSEAQIKAIVYLVAGSVEGLRPENIYIVDTKSNILYDPTAAVVEEGTVAAAMEEQMLLKRKFERELEARVQGLVEQVVGSGKAVATVSAQLDFDSKGITEIEYTEPVPRSEQKIFEYYEGQGQLPEEVAEPNIPGYVTPENPSDYMYIREESIVNNEIGETLTQIVTAPGKVTRLSVAVVYDDDGTKGELQPQLANLVKSAIGFDDTRGDSVEVAGMPFDTTRELLQHQQRIRYWITVGSVAAVALGLVLWLLVARRRRRLEEEEELLPEEGMLSEEMEVPVTDDEEELRGKVREMVNEEPQNVALLLRTWLVED